MKSLSWLKSRGERLNDMGDLLDLTCIHSHSAHHNSPCFKREVDHVMIYCLQYMSWCNDALYIYIHIHIITVIIIAIIIALIFVITTMYIYIYILAHILSHPSQGSILSFEEVNLIQQEMFVELCFVPDTEMSQKWHFNGLNVAQMYHTTITSTPRLLL